LNGSVTKFVFQYLESNDIDEDEKTFVSNYKLNPSIIKELIEFHHLENPGEKQTDKMNPVIEAELRNAIKAKIGRQLFGDLAFYQILNDEDPVLIEAMNAQKSYNQLTQKD